MLAHAQHNAASHSNIGGPQEILLGAPSTSQGPPPEHFITVSHASHISHLPHVSNLSRHINPRYFNLSKLPITLKFYWDE